MLLLSSDIVAAHPAGLQDQSLQVLGMFTAVNNIM
jgi:hypothetical protein